MMAMTGEPGQGAVRIPISLVDMGAAMWAGIGVLSALRKRDETGEGTLVETSLFETSAWWLNYHIVGYLASGKTPERWGSGTAMIAPYEVFPTADDGIVVGAANDNLFKKFSAALGVPEMAQDVRFWTNAVRVENRAAMQEIIRDRMRARSSADWEETFKEYGIPYSRVHSIADLVEMEQFKAINMLQDVPHPEVPDLKLIDLPFMHNHQRTVDPGPPPKLGEHNDDILSEIGYSESEREQLRSDGIVD
jgi:formyl-CoA transferase/CoA:oxalate CoA-transferase